MANLLKDTPAEWMLIVMESLTQVVSLVTRTLMDQATKCLPAICVEIKQMKSFSKELYNFLYFLYHQYDVCVDTARTRLGFVVFVNLFPNKWEKNRV